jgi:NmrA-like family
VLEDCQHTFNFHTFHHSITLYQFETLSNMAASNTLILVGGTGGLGMKIAKGLATAVGFDKKKAIVRDAVKGKELEDMGWTLVPVADFTDAAALEAAFVGAKTVVSTFSGADLVALEKATVAAAKKVGASLFVPAQFGVDYRRWPNRPPILGLQATGSRSGQRSRIASSGSLCGILFGLHLWLSSRSCQWQGSSCW